MRIAIFATATIFWICGYALSIFAAVWLTSLMPAVTPVNLFAGSVVFCVVLGLGAFLTANGGMRIAVRGLFA